MQQNKRAFLGISFILGAQLLFCTNFSLVAYLSSHFSFIQLILFRSLLGPLLCLPFLLSGKIKLNFSRPWMLLMRASCGLLAMSCLYIGLKQSDIGPVSLMFNFSIIWTFILAFFIFNDRPHRYSLFSLGLAFLGLSLVFYPLNLTLTKGIFFAFLGSLFATGVILSLKSLRSTHDSLTIVLFFQFFACVVYVFPAQLSFSLLDSPFLLLLIATGIISFSAQSLLTTGYKYTTASVASALGLAQIPLMYLSGYLFFDQHITLINMLGVSLVLFSLIIISLYR